MTKPYLLALDLGTTGNRAIVFDKNQNVILKTYEEFPQIYPKPGWVEHDPEAIWQSVRKILGKTFKRISPRKIAALGITNQRETIVLWDKKSGRPVYNAIVWQCRRSAPFCDALKGQGFESFIHDTTGLFLDPYFSASKIHWILENVKGARRRAETGNILAGTIDAWILWKLSGGSTHVTDSSNASRTMLFNIHKMIWDAELCRLFKVPMNLLPKVVPSSAFSAVVDRRLFGCELNVTGIVGDQQAASFAQGVFSPGIIKNTYGTGLFALEHTGSKPRFSNNLLTTVAWSIGDLKKTEYAVEGSVFIAGAAIQWLRDGLKILKNASDSEKIARSVTSNGGVFFVPAFVGLGAPYWDPHARGVIIGLTRGTSRAHLVRAALESICYQTRDILDVMQTDTRHKAKSLRVDGGASANDFLMQFQADILGLPIERPRILETTALGAAGLAGLSIGFWKDKKEFNARRKIDRQFYPKMKRPESNSLYKKWQQAVHCSRVIV